MVKIPLFLTFLTILGCIGNADNVIVVFDPLSTGKARELVTLVDLGLNLTSSDTISLLTSTLTAKHIEGLVPNSDFITSLVYPTKEREGQFNSLVDTYLTNPGIDSNREAICGYLEEFVHSLNRSFDLLIYEQPTLCSFDALDNITSSKRISIQFEFPPNPEHAFVEGITKPFRVKYNTELGFLSTVRERFELLSESLWTTFKLSHWKTNLAQRLDASNPNSKRSFNFVLNSFMFVHPQQMPPNYKMIGPLLPKCQSLAPRIQEFAKNYDNLVVVRSSLPSSHPLWKNVLTTLNTSNFGTLWFENGSSDDNTPQNVLTLTETEFCDKVYTQLPITFTITDFDSAGLLEGLTQGVPLVLYRLPYQSQFEAALEELRIQQLDISVIEDSTSSTELAQIWDSVNSSSTTRGRMQRLQRDFVFMHHPVAEFTKWSSIYRNYDLSDFILTDQNDLLWFQYHNLDAGCLVILTFYLLTKILWFLLKRIIMIPFRLVCKCFRKISSSEPKEKQD
mmetsp:Transcript_53200/g.60974  ORF Transcript_53200/g.60974 Transcript_53200/m.60974 type:complete len:507 (-) Transcript_53200:286-1806(-)